MLTGEGFSQCFTGTDCTDDQVPAANKRECCIGTNDGLSYNDRGTCTECIGNVTNVCNYRTPNETKKAKGSNDVLTFTRRMSDHVSPFTFYRTIFLAFHIKKHSSE